MQFLNTTAAVEGFKQFRADPSFPGGTFAVIGVSTDTTPPTIALSSISPLTVPVGGTVTIVAHITDDSGVAAASIQTLPSTAATIYVPLSQASGTPQDGMWQVNLIPTALGIYNLTAIAAQDTAGNFGQIGGPPPFLGSFTVTGATDPGLGSAGTFAVLSGAVITSTGPSWITGAMGTRGAITGFPPATSGPQHVADPAYTTAAAGLTAAFANAGQPCTTDYTGVGLGGLTLGPGVYCQNPAPVLTGTLTLSGGGVYIFQIGSALVTAPGARISLINGAQPCDIFWRVGSSASIARSTAFVGNIMAGFSIQMQTGATLSGRALARSGAVTLDTNRIIQPSGCTGGFTTNYPPPAFVSPPLGNILPGTLGADQPISGTGMNVSAAEGQAFTGAVATFNDADPNSTSAEYAALIDWGDGFPTGFGTISPIGDGFAVRGSHTYAEEGSRSVSVRIIDTDDPANNTNLNSTASVADAALIPRAACLTTSLQSYVGPTAGFTDTASPFGTLSDFSATIDWGDGALTPGAVTGTDGGPYAVGGSHAYATTGTFTITTTIKDAAGSVAITSCNALEFALAPGGGSFVIGDRNALIGSTVKFWGAQWAKLNSISCGSAPASFKGFAEHPSTPACGIAWSADPGNSTPPPQGPLPDFMAVIVTSSASKHGSTISGNTVHIVIVQTNPGYAPNPGHEGTGRVVAVIC